MPVVRILDGVLKTYMAYMTVWYVDLPRAGFCEAPLSSKKVCIGISLKNVLPQGSQSLGT